MPICDADKKTLKANMRKLAIYNEAYRFCNELFELELLMNTRDESMSDEGNLDSPMSPPQLLEFTSGILSIVLSHHFQKADIKSIT